jgi:hypothetical protein
MAVLAASSSETGTPSSANAMAGSRARASGQLPRRARSSCHPGTTLGVRLPSKGEADSSRRRQSTSPSLSAQSTPGSSAWGTGPRNCSTSVVPDAAS